VTANESERERWNDDQRLSVWPKRERLTSEVTPLLIEALAPAPGEKILDVGSGGGRAALAAAEIVGGEGTVVGFDISQGLTRLARERAEEAGVGNVRFVVGDAQTDGAEGGPFDAAMSQFGVMFFDDPLLAFANICEQLRPGGRIAFVCWQPREANPWYFSDAIAAFVPAPVAPPRAGVVPPGPFSLGDVGRTTDLLERAGFDDIECTPHELLVLAPEDSLLDEVQLQLLGIPEAELAPAMEAAKAYMSRFRVDDERSRFRLAVQIFQAVRR
jgi:protein-L-isoaspartate O-methyltransferase